MKSFRQERASIASPLLVVLQFLDFFTYASIRPHSGQILSFKPELPNLTLGLTLRPTNVPAGLAQSIFSPAADR
jgi:hypothetical protein